MNAGLPATETALPPQMETLRRRLVRSHNNKVRLLFLLVLGSLLYWLLASRIYEHKNDPFPQWLIAHAPIFLALPAFFGGAVLIELRDRGLSLKWGFVCPHCGAPLYKAESVYWPGKSVRETGDCPKCGQKVF